MRLSITTLLALLPFCVASPVLLAYSTLPHFLCNGVQTPLCDRPHPQQIPNSALNQLVSHLSAPETAHETLPLARTAIAPELVLIVNSPTLRSDVQSVLRRISTAVTPSTESNPIGTSFHAITDDSQPDLSTLNPTQVDSIDKLLAMVDDRSLSIFDNGQTDVLSLSVAHEREDGLMAALHSLAERADGRLALLWTAREDAADAADVAAPEAPKDDDAAAAADADAPKADHDEKDTDENAPKSDDANAATNSTEGLYGGKMHKPEITDSQVAGLLVGLVFLFMFIPGIMCLYRIQSPQTFDLKMQ